MDISTPRSNLVVRFLAVFLLCCTSLYASADQTGKQKITVVASDVTLETVFKQIEKQTGLKFMYAVDAVDVREKVTVAFEKVMLDDVLESLLGKKRIEWMYREGIISLRIRSYLVSLLKDSVASKVKELTITVSGKILDKDGNPIPGATVMIKGGKRGTRTNVDGSFVLVGVQINTVLEIRSIGFESKDVVVDGNSLIVRMNGVINRLDETVIRGGYYMDIQRYSTGNATSIKAEAISKQPVSDPLLALQGRVPGMIITQTTGVQGGRVNVQIRGKNSLTKGTVPLFIVDGIPYAPNLTASTLASFGAMGNVISALNFINPGDIESIDILKDADATAIYGSRGANGVVLINTKKGKIGSTKVDLNFYKGYANVARKKKLLNTKEYLEMRNEAYRNDDILPSSNPTDQGYAPDLMIWDTTQYTDWQQKLIGETANYTDLQGSLAGGNMGIQYFLSGNYHKESTVFPGDFSSEKGGGHFSITGVSPNQKLRATLTGEYTINSTNFPGIDFAVNTTLPPNAPNSHNSDGSLNWANSTWENPYAQIKGRLLEINNNNLLYSIDMMYSLLPGLSIRCNAGYNDLRNNSFSGSMIAGVDPRFKNLGVTATAVYADTRSKSWNFEPQFTFNRIVGGNELNLLGGLTLLGNESVQQTGITRGIKEDALIRNPASAATYTIRGADSKYKYAAVFGRFGYRLLDKYLLNFTVRRDGSSRFGPRKQFSNFFSIGTGWIFSQEKLVKQMLPFLSFGKLRASYGTTGNDQIGDYQYLDRYDFQQLPYQAVKGLSVVGVFNADFAWELTKKAEIGLETGFFKDKLFISTSYYRNRSTNQLIGYPLPSMTGTEFIEGNLPAVIQNAGLEVAATSKNISEKNFEWTSSFNISVSRNKLVSYSGNGSIYAKQGRSISVIDIFKILNVDAGTGVYSFSDDEGKPLPVDQATPIASVELSPSFFGGLQNTFTFKGLQLDLFLQFAKQKGASGLINPDYIPGTRRNQPVEVLDRWRKVGDIKRMQKFSQNNQLYREFAAWLTSDRTYGDASYIRLKNISLSWQIPSKIRQKLHLNYCKLYFQGQNILTLTKYKGWDPETQSAVAIPPLRVFTFGIQVSM